MIDNRSLEKKLLALSRGETVEFTEEEKQQIGQIEEIEANQTENASQKEAS